MTAPLTQNERVRRFIEANPLATTMQIQQGCDPWISNPRARISEIRAALREEGGDLVCEKRSDGFEGFRIVQPRPEPQPLRGTQMEVSW